MEWGYEVTTKCLSDEKGKYVSLYLHYPQCFSVFFFYMFSLSK